MYPRWGAGFRFRVWARGLAPQTSGFRSEWPSPTRHLKLETCNLLRYIRPMETIFETDIKELKLLSRGKVRDIYEVGDSLLLVASDRLSAYDVVMQDPIPGKGAILTGLSNFWFNRTAKIIENHIQEARPWAAEPGNAAYQKVKGRAVLVRKTVPIKIESVVRGYLAGSGWDEYQKSESVCGIKLPAGLNNSDKLPEPIFTPATKAPMGEHDINISYEEACNIVGKDVATKVRDTSIEIYRQSADYARERGVIIADTKFEFGEVGGKLIIIDEMLTPDSSRFWPMDLYEPGKSQPSYDKQFVRDYLLSINFNKKPPAPKLPEEIIRKTAEKYKEALQKLDPDSETLAML